MKFEKVDEEKERVYVNLDMQDDAMDLVINGKWELHIRTSEGNLSVDAYHVFDKEDEDHDYDEDFITGLGWLSYDDLNYREGEE